MSDSGSFGNVAYQRSQVNLGPLSVIVDCPSISPTHTFLVCHGYGANAADLASLGEHVFQRICSPTFAPLFLFPNALIDMTPQGLPGGYAWWNLNMQRLMEATASGSFDELRSEKPPGIDDAAEAIKETLEAASSTFNCPSDELILAGFSQGAMLSMHLACISDLPKPSKLLLYSGALVNEQEWRNGLSRLKDVKAVQSHGRMDPILPLETGHWLRDLLNESPCENQFVEFDGFHEIGPSALSASLQLLADTTTPE